MIKKTQKEEKEAKVEFDIGFGGLFGGLCKGIEHLVDLAEKAEKAGGTLRKEWELRGGTQERPVRGIYGFTVRTGLGKKSRIETFGNIKKTKQGPQVTETREPIVDVFDEKDHVLLIAELPGIDESSIKLELTGDIFLLEAGSGNRKYAKEILLKDKIDFNSRETSFKNGILELKFKKVK